MFLPSRIRDEHSPKFHRQFYDLVKKVNMMLTNFNRKILNQKQMLLFTAVKVACRKFSTTPSSCKVTAAFLPQFLRKKRLPNIAVINLFGMIQYGNARLGGKKYLNLESLDKSIEKAFATKRLKAVCLMINSPGGSAVQSELIANRIIQLSRSKNVKTISFVEDMALSGGYWLALAGSEIFVSKNSLIGSVGALFQSFGLHNFIKRYGVEHRLHTAGENKVRMNPFAPEKESDVEKIKQVIYKIHENFIDHVKQQRGDRLKKDDQLLFNGDIWTGVDAVAYGLVDGIDDFNSYVKRNYGDDVNIVRVNPSVKKGLVSLLGVSSETIIEDIENCMVSNRIKLF